MKTNSSSSTQQKIWKTTGLLLLLAAGPLMAGCATTEGSGATKVGGQDTPGSASRYSGGAPIKATTNGPAYYRTTENPYHSD